jgi:formylglycine-generating enzyme required for sulfatase activity
LWQHSFARDDDGYSIELSINDGYGDYILVPAGKYSMGDNFNDGNPRERPVHTVYLDSYYIGKYEVTNEEYKKFMDDGGYSNPDYWSNGGFLYVKEFLYWNDSTYNGGGIEGNDKFPVSGVCWFEAMAYCSWLSVKTGNAYRLPTEAEWEKAARGGDFLDGDDNAQVPNPFTPSRRYPWGNNIDGSYANYIDSGDPYDNGLTPVGYYDGSTRGTFSTHDNASPYGVYDMAGNVYEWCRDFYGEDYYQTFLSTGTVTNPQGPESGSIFVIRGSAFLYKTFKQRCAYRGAYYPSFRGAYIGIRCVREISAQ